MDFTINLTKYSNKNQVDESKSGYLPAGERTDWLEQVADMTYSDPYDKSMSKTEKTIMFYPPINPNNN